MFLVQCLRTLPSAAAATAKSLQSLSDSVRPHRQQPTRLPRPWDSPGKNTGVGCHFLLQCMKVKSESEVVETSWTAAYQAPPAMGFSRQEYWSRVPLPSLAEKLYGTKHNCVHVQLGPIPDKRNRTKQKTKKVPNATSEEPGIKTGCWGKKASTVHGPCAQHHQKEGQTPKSGFQPSP